MRKIVCYHSPTSEEKRIETGNPNRIMRKPGLALTLTAVEDGIKADWKLLMMEETLMNQGTVVLTPHEQKMYTLSYSLATKRMVVQEKTFGSMFSVANKSMVDVASWLTLADGTILLKLYNMISYVLLDSDFGEFESVTTEAGERPYTCFSGYSIEAELLMELAAVKSEALNQVNFLNSLAYLETQVDILYAVLEANKDAITIPDELKEAIAASQEVSVLTTDSAEKVMENIGRKKTFREIQKEYRDVKALLVSE